MPFSSDTPVELSTCFERAVEAGHLSTIASQYRAVAQDDGFDGPIMFHPQVVDRHLRAHLTEAGRPLFAITQSYYLLYLWRIFMCRDLSRSVRRRLTGLYMLTPLVLAGDYESQSEFEGTVPGGSTLLDAFGRLLEPWRSFRLAPQLRHAFINAGWLQLVLPELDEGWPAYECAVLRLDFAREIATWLYDHSTFYSGRGGQILVIDLNDQDSLRVQRKAWQRVTSYQDAEAEIAREVRARRLVPRVRDLLVATDWVLDEPPSQTARELRALRLIQHDPDTDDLARQKSAERTLRDRREALGLSSKESSG